MRLTEEEAMNPEYRICAEWDSHIIKVAGDPMCECGEFTLKEIGDEYFNWDRRRALRES